MKNILKELTIKEKIKLTAGLDLWKFMGNERLGIKSFVTADGPHGVRVYKSGYEEGIFDKNELKESTMFPIAAAMASTFNEDLLRQAGEVIGNECNHNNVDVLLGPGVNLKRSPLGGRNFEYYSEDPFLSGKMGAAFIKGAQSTGVAACVKHFALNEQETLRRYVDTSVDERTLHEMYLLPFEIAIKEGKPKTLMTAYNRVLGDYAAESKILLQDILRNKWGFDGVTISDWSGVQNKVKSIKNGLNLEMSGPSEFEDEVLKAIEEGTLSTEELDASLKPLFKLASLMESNPNKGKETNFEANHLVASEIAKEAIVLLENDGILPLQERSKIGVIGSFAKTPRVNGGGSATLKAYILENPLKELEKRFDVEFAPGYIEENTSDALLKDVYDVANNNDVVLYFTGTTEALESEGRERPHMKLPQGHLEVFQKIKETNAKVIVILSNGSALDVTGISGNANAIIEAWMLGSANAVPLVDILVGTVNPSGKLTETFPLCIENTPHYGSYPSKHEITRYEGDLINNGYRYYETHKYPVRYPFGHGLSYTSFDISDINVSNTDFDVVDTIKVKVSVSNTGLLDGKETVQVYVRENNPLLPKPSIELKGFKKVLVKASGKKDVTIELDKRAFSFYSVELKSFVVAPGMYTILVGNSVQNILCEAEVEVKTSVPYRAPLTLTHSIDHYVLHHPDFVDYLEERFGTIMWFDREQPLGRIINRYQKHHQLTDDDVKEILSKI